MLKYLDDVFPQLKTFVVFPAVLIQHDFLSLSKTLSVLLRQFFKQTQLVTLHYEPNLN